MTVQFRGVRRRDSVANFNYQLLSNFVVKVKVLNRLAGSNVFMHANEWAVDMKDERVILVEGKKEIYTIFHFIIINQFILI